MVKRSYARNTKPVPYILAVVVHCQEKYGSFTALLAYFGAYRTVRTVHLLFCLVIQIAVESKLFHCTSHIGMTVARG